MELYYCPSLTDEAGVLSEEESYHCIKILRNRPGDLIHVTDGKGFLYLCRIEKADLKKCAIQVIDKKENQQKRDFRLHIALAPTKNSDRTEFFVEKATELGIDEITFLRCDRSERKEIKPERMEKIAIAAMKQSKKTILPKINPVIPFTKFVKEDFSESKFIACLIDNKSIQLSGISRNFTSYLFLVGPEGDFTPDELSSAIGNNFSPLLLGDSVLRTETAGVAIAVWVNLMKGDT